MSVPSPDAILHLATLHLLSQAGFASTSQAASLSLTSVVAQYFKLISRSSIDRAILAGRNKPGTLDVVESLKELGHGFGLEELYEYGLDHGGNVLEGDSLELLSDYLEDGRALSEPLAELKLVSREEAEALLEEEDAISTGSPNGEEIKEEPMEVDGDEDSKPHVHASPVQWMRFQSPDYSWLPPLPDALPPSRATIGAVSTTRTGPDETAQASLEPIAAPASIADRYRTRIPFASSSLSSQSIYDAPQPQPQPTRRSAATPPTSLPHLIQTYKDTRNEMSVALRLNGSRLQALDLLRRQIAAPEGYGPDDSLAAPDVVPGPKVSPIAVPAHPVAINPSHQGILSQLVHSIHSANLPPELRERLTSLRPPLAQKRDGQLLTYGPGVRGADQAALLRHQGKQAEDKDEVYAYATWDSGPRGQEKFSRGTLPRGKKVIKFVEGEEFPRQQEKRKSVDTTGDEAGRAPKTTLRLKLGDSASPAPPPVSEQAARESSAFTEPPLATPGGTTIKLRIPGSQEPRSPAPAPGPAAVPTGTQEEGPRGTPSGDLPGMHLSTRSPSQQPPPSDAKSPSGPSAAPTEPTDQPPRPESEADTSTVDRKPSPTSLQAVPRSPAEPEPLLDPSRADSEPQNELAAETDAVVSNGTVEMAERAESDPPAQQKTPV